MTYIYTYIDPPKNLWDGILTGKHVVKLFYFNVINEQDRGRRVLVATVFDS